MLILTPSLIHCPPFAPCNVIPTPPHPCSLLIAYSRYLENPEEREEGGTPDIVGAVRCGLVFQLQAAAMTSRIQAREAAMVQTVMKALTSHPRIHVLGPSQTDRLPVSRALHHAPGITQHTQLVHFHLTTRLFLLMCPSHTHTHALALSLSYLG